MSNAPAPEARDAGERLLRLLAMLAHLARVGEERVEVLAARFGMDERAVVAELELAACCGLPPYTPDQLLELVVDDGTVVAWGLDALRRPRQLTPDEGFALAASARALLAVTGMDAEGPLATALAKLERVLGEDRVMVELDVPDALAVVRRAAAEGELIEIDYRGASRGAMTTRLVEPYSVVAREGRFYLDAYCHLAEDWRRFQVARIVAVRPTGRYGEVRTPPPELGGTRAFAGGPGLPIAEVAVPKARAALLERFASGPPQLRDDGSVVVSIEVGDTAWFGRLLLRLGGDAEVLEPDELAGTASAVARRALERYGAP